MKKMFLKFNLITSLSTVPAFSMINFGVFSEENHSIQTIHSKITTKRKLVHE